MLAFRGILAVAMVVLGAAIVVRTLPFGFRVEILPAIVLGAAMIALGVHRISLILRIRSAR